MIAVFLKILNMSISASWLALVVLVVRFLLKKAPKWLTVLLWGMVAVRLICPFSFESALSLTPSSETLPRDIVLGPDFDINSGIEPIDRRVNDYLGDRYFEGVTVPAGNGFNVMRTLSTLWIGGVVIMTAYAAVSYCGLRRRVSDAVRLRDNIYQSENVDSPFVFGLLRPRIYLPFGMEQKPMEQVIAHERAHISRRDHWWKPLGFVLLTVHWFNPLLWVCYLLLCRDIELACDQKVIKQMKPEEKADYSQVLVDCSVSRTAIAACPLAFGEVGVKERVKSVMNYKKPTFWMVAAAVLACLFVAVCFLTDPVAPEFNEESNPNSAGIYDGRITQLLEIIGSSPLHSSNPGDYIDEHNGEYRELLNYGEYTLKYCFTEFLRGGQTDLRGHIMALACVDIMAEWGEGYITDRPIFTGQDWFKDFELNACTLADQLTGKDMQKSYPGAYMLYQMIKNDAKSADGSGIVEIGITSGTLCDGILPSVGYNTSEKYLIGNPEYNTLNEYIAANRKYDTLEEYYNAKQQYK